MEQSAQNIVSEITTCKYCGREIGFKDRKPYDVKFISNSLWQLTTPHFMNCPHFVKRRITEHCVWCQLLDRGRPASEIANLIDWEKCDKHSDPTQTFTYHGRTYHYDRESFRAILHEDRLRERWLKKSQKLAGGTESITAFLEP